MEALVPKPLTKRQTNSWCLGEELTEKLRNAVGSSII
jgi:hypothetical protein